MRDGRTGVKRGKAGKREEEGKGKVGGLTVSVDFLRVDAILLSLQRAGSVFIQGGWNYRVIHSKWKF